ncbi:hypothetical protein [Heyndrickxia acidicola]|uniref:Uncharacterized protein n=1 Tax=Heyndrickxia acidicola TaxID=209389 RepID=A0ABU6MFP2_9BACI|nr:hypothetical protein [Heyndrickxia acidicola]MED1203515.1 hypothetical protein [Heyndrickxia acidicola]
MLGFILGELKNWWITKSTNEIKEFEHLEAKHTRVRYDQDIYETIRIH